MMVQRSTFGLRSEESKKRKVQSYLLAKSSVSRWRLVLSLNRLKNSSKESHQNRRFLKTIAISPKKYGNLKGLASRSLLSRKSPTRHPMVLIT